MPTTTDFAEWLDNLDLEYYGDIESLADSVSTSSTVGAFTTTRQGHSDRWFVKAVDSDLTLMLASEKAKALFFRFLEVRFANGEDLNGWIAYCRAMEKDD